jgi:hypothetical protein
MRLDKDSKEHGLSDYEDFFYNCASDFKTPSSFLSFLFLFIKSFIKY